VFSTVDTLLEADRLEAALLFAGNGATLSGAAALRVSGIAGISPPSSVLVLVPPVNRSRSFGWVRIRRSFRPIRLEQWIGPRRADVARAVADFALDRSRLDDVRSVVARAVQQRRCTVEEIGAELEAGPRNGSALLRRALEEVGWGAESAPEARAARILRRHGFEGFVQNAEIRLADGRTRRLDFYWPRLRAALEIDGAEYHLGALSWRATLDRHLELTTLGISVVHRPPSALSDEHTFVADIRGWLAGRERELRRGLPA
jgi:hypothetical protein